MADPSRRLDLARLAMQFVMIGFILAGGIFNHKSIEFQNKRIDILAWQLSGRKPLIENKSRYSPTPYSFELRETPMVDTPGSLGSDQFRHMNKETKTDLLIICKHHSKDPCEIWDGGFPGDKSAKLMATVKDGKVTVKKGYSREQIESRIRSAQTDIAQKNMESMLKYPEKPRTYPEIQEW